MPELTPDERDRGLDYAKKLALIASEAPDLFAESLVQPVVTRMFKYYGYSRDMKKARIIRLVKEQGGASFQELAELTRWQKNVIHELAVELREEHRIEFRNMPAAGGKGGMPRTIIFVMNGVKITP